MNSIEDMYPILNDIFSDKQGGEIFACYGIWHFLYIFLAVVAVALTIYLVKNKDESVKDKTLKMFIGIAFGLYVADFFLMPFAYGEIDVDKLPFHVCTSMCIMCFLSNHVDWLKRYRLNFAMLGMLSNLIYLIYPAGVMWYEIHPLSYRVIQTLLFHGVMTSYGVLAIVFRGEELNIKKCHRDLVILGTLTVWAMVGNELYSGSAGDYDRYFNWFFVRSDPLGIFPESISHYISPWLNIVVFFTLEVMIYLAFIAIKKAHQSKRVQAI